LLRRQESTTSKSTPRQVLAVMLILLEAIMWAVVLMAALAVAVLEVIKLNSRPNIGDQID
jgi:hypothetical protein